MLQWTLRISTSRLTDYLWLRSPPCRSIPLTQRALVTSIRIRKCKSLWISFDSTIKSSIWRTLYRNVPKWSLWIFVELVVNSVLLGSINTTQTSFSTSTFTTQKPMTAVWEFPTILYTSDALDSTRSTTQHSAAPPPHTPPHNGGWEFICHKDISQLARIQRKTCTLCPASVPGGGHYLHRV